MVDELSYRETFIRYPTFMRISMAFTLFNIPVNIHPTFWIFLLFLTDIIHDPSIESVLIGIVAFISLLVHEYGHALTAKYYGKAPTITLEAFGGRASYSAYGISKKQEFLITLNGPLLESMLILISYGLLKSGIFAYHYYIQYILYITMHINILWCLLNLIPIEPLDGGHLLRYFLEKQFEEKGEKISLVVGMVCAALAAPLVYFYWGALFFPVLLVIFGFQNYQKLLQYQARNNVSPFKRLMMAMEAVQSNNLDGAKKILQKLIKVDDKQIKHSAIESLAKIYFEENNAQKAYKLLLNTDHEQLQEGKSLLCKLAFEQNNHALVAKYSHDIYALEPTFETAILNSQTFACLNQPELAWGWLTTASMFGTEYHNKVKELLDNSLFDAVKEYGASLNDLSS